MEQDLLKTAWRSMTTTPKDHTEVKNMMKESAHPVLKRIRKQLVIEIAAFSVFLFVYYDLFDGDQKPLSVNVLLVTAVLFAIMHTIMGYMLTKHRVKGNNIKQSLETHLYKMKLYAVVSIVSRVLVAICLLIFFTSVITFTMDKYWILVVVIIVFLIQIALLSGIWIKRIRQIKEDLNSLLSVK